MRSPTGIPGRAYLVTALVALCCGSPGLPAMGVVEAASASALPTLGVPPAGEFYHSAFPGGVTGEEDDITAETVASYEDTVGRRVAWVYFSHNWYRDRAFPLATATWIRGRGSVPYVRLMLRSDPRQDHAEPLFTLEAIASGAFDADLGAWGDAARAFASPILAEFGTEMNGSWFSWNGVWNGGAGEGPRRFRDAYRHIVETVRGRGATNVTWIFHVNQRDIPEEDWNRMENYFPGADVVDGLGLSVYGAGSPLDDEWPPFAEGMDRMVPRLSALAPGKPVYVLEFAASSGNPLGDAAAWADAALEEMLAGRWPAVRGFSWWNEAWENDDNPAHDTDMRVQTVPGLGEVFRRRLSDPRVLDRPIIAPAAESRASP